MKLSIVAGLFYVSSAQFLGNCSSNTHFDSRFVCHFGFLTLSQSPSEFRTVSSKSVHVVMFLFLLVASKGAVCVLGEVTLIVKSIIEFERQQLSLSSHVCHSWQVSPKSSPADCF